MLKGKKFDAFTLRLKKTFTSLSVEVLLKEYCCAISRHFCCISIYKKQYVENKSLITLRLLNQRFP